MKEFILPPAIANLCKNCETICEVACCGVGAFHFSPFNVISHLTWRQGLITKEDVAAIRSELAVVDREFRSDHWQGRKILISELNAIMTPEKVLLLVAEISFALSEACEIYAAQKLSVDERYKNFNLLMGAPE